jgi:hypothetical protein
MRYILLCICSYEAVHVGEVDLLLVYFSLHLRGHLNNQHVVIRKCRLIHKVHVQITKGGE